MRSGLRLVVVAALAALLGACTPAPSNSGEDPQSTVEALPPTGDSTVDADGTPAPTTGAGAWCALAPPALVASTLGIDLRTPTATFTSDEIRCTYVPVAEGDSTIALRFRTDQTHGTFVAYRESLNSAEEPTSDLPGVGDEAFYQTDEFDVQITNIVVARRGTVAVHLEGPGTLAECTSLMIAILAQLG